MNIKQFLDSTYLKTSDQSGLTEEQTWQKVKELTQEAIDHGIFAVMIRPEYMSRVRKMIDEAESDVVLGCVISFHEGDLSTEDKLNEAQKALEDGADELDFVINYRQFISGNLQFVADEVLQGNRLVLEAGKTIKWIIETAALNANQIAEITDLIRGVTEKNFPGKESRVFVKTSTGFYDSADGKPIGATIENVKIMLEHAGKLPVKAAGGIRTREEAIAMLDLGIKRIGTSSALAISDGAAAEDSY
ncbi:MAG: deoxyribose-phosphate aldolase [Flavobacteriaceae bacterium]|nr:deoxyribose-phosphate aldolase [Flavobacteriaceae bacterium]